MENNIKDFIYENRPVKVGDTIVLKTGLVVGTTFENFVIDIKIKNFISRMPPLLKVSMISKDGKFCKIYPKLKGGKGKVYELMLPAAFFKIIKVPKMQDVVTWLYDNKPIIYPTEWEYFKTDISFINRYIIKIFQNNLRAIYLANKTCNHLYDNHDELEVLVFYKTLIQQLGLSYHERYSNYNKINSKKAFVAACLQIDPSWHTLDAISIWEMNNRNVFDGQYLSCADRLKFYKDPSAKMKFENNKEQLENLKQLISEKEKINSKLKMDNDNRFIKTLNQEVIDDLELTIFNVKSIPSKNQVLIIFIDKDNNKRFYIKPFNFVFYVSSDQKIMMNDYIVQYDPNKHIAFAIQNFEVLRNLKFAVNSNYKMFMKKGSFK